MIPSQKTGGRSPGRPASGPNKSGQSVLSGGTCSSRFFCGAGYGGIYLQKARASAVFGIHRDFLVFWGNSGYPQVLKCESCSWWNSVKTAILHDLGMCFKHIGPKTFLKSDSAPPTTSCLFNREVSTRNIRSFLRIYQKMKRDRN